MSDQPTPSIEQIKAERDVYLAAIKEALRIPERHEATPISETVRRHAYLVGRQVAVDEFRSILEAALVSPVAEEPTPLDPEPKTLDTHPWKCATGNCSSPVRTVHEYVWMPDPEFEQDGTFYGEQSTPLDPEPPRLPRHPRRDHDWPCPLFYTGNWREDRTPIRACTHEKGCPAVDRARYEQGGE